MDTLLTLYAVRKTIDEAIAKLTPQTDPVPAQGAPVPGSLATQFLQPAQDLDPDAIRRRNENLAREEASRIDRWHNGLFPVERLSPEDKIFITWAQQYYKGELWYDNLVRGLEIHIRASMLEGDANRAQPYDIAKVNPDLRNEVYRKLQGQK